MFFISAESLDLGMPVFVSQLLQKTVATIRCQKRVSGSRFEQDMVDTSTEAFIILAC